jgi:hypothetical protein
VPSLISACAAAKMLERGFFAHYPRGVRARSERPPLIPTRLRRPFPSFLHCRRGRVAPSQMGFSKKAVLEGASAD